MGVRIQRLGWTQHRSWTSSCSAEGHYPVFFQNNLVQSLLWLRNMSALPGCVPNIKVVISFFLWEGGYLTRNGFRSRNKNAIRPWEVERGPSFTKIAKPRPEKFVRRAPEIPRCEIRGRYWEPVSRGSDCYQQDGCSVEGWVKAEARIQGQGPYKIARNGKYPEVSVTQD